MPTKIIEKVGNLLHVKSGHIVHGCNNQGVMGSGVALGIKQTWPEVYENYRVIYNEEGFELGEVSPVVAEPGLIVWNAITQDGFGSGRRFTSYDAIATCFETINRYIVEMEAAQKSGNLYNSDTTLKLTPSEIHIPLIGAARGGGNWNIIRTIIEETVDVPVTLWLPDSTVTTL